MANERPETPDIRVLRERFEAHDQGHVLRFWERLDASARENLARQLAAIDLPTLLREFRATQERPGAPPKLEPPVVEALPAHGGDARRHEAARARGEALLSEGRIAMMVVAGGQASRLGYPGPKGLFPLGPVSGRTLFEQQAQKLRRLRARFGAAIPWYVMTSDATDAETRRAFEEAECFGLPPADVFFLRQGMVPSFDFDGKLMLERPDRLFENPDGHGGSLTALHRSGALDDLQRRDITTLFYYQVDNPLVPLGDPVLLGFHAEAAADVSCKALRKRDPAEKMGVLARVNGHIGVVEYTEIDAESRDARDDAGELVYHAGNAAVHAFEVSFVRRIADEAERWLPFHASPKAIACVDDDGETHKPAEPNGHKLERFVFDALPAADSVAIVEAPRDEYSPVKNRSGTDSPETARRDLSAHYRRWISDAGLPEPAPGTWIEIDESKVGDADDLRELGIARIEETDCIHTRLGDDS